MPGVSRNNLLTCLRCTFGGMLKKLQTSFCLFILLMGIGAPMLPAQTGFYGSLELGTHQRKNGIPGAINDYFATQTLHLQVAYQRQWEGKFLQHAAVALGYRNFNMQLRSKHLAFYDNSHFQQNLTLGNDGLELAVQAARRVNDFTTFTAGISALLHFPGSMKYETEMQTNPNYMDSGLYQFSGYQVRSAAYYNTKGTRLNPSVRLGLEVRLSQRTQLLLGYQRFLQPFEGVSEVATMTAFKRSGGSESMGYSQSYELPMRYLNIGLKYRWKR